MLRVHRVSLKMTDLSQVALSLRESHALSSPLLAAQWAQKQAFLWLVATGACPAGETNMTGASASGSREKTGA